MCIHSERERDRERSKITAVSNFISEIMNANGECNEVRRLIEPSWWWCTGGYGGGALGLWGVIYTSLCKMCRNSSDWRIRC